MQSNSELDLDINNYNTTDLCAFFKLSNNFTEYELNEREKQMSFAILNAEGTKYTTEYKFAVLNFVKKVKDTLKVEFLGKSLENEFYKPIIDKVRYEPPTVPKPVSQPNNVARLLNPLSNHPSFENSSIPFYSSNGYNTGTVITNYVFNTKYRDDYFTSISTNSTYSFPMIKNVISVQLSAIQFPNVIYTFSNQKKNTQIYIKDDSTNNEAVVVIPEGNYSIFDFPSVFEEAINTQLLGVYVPGGPNIYSVTIHPNTLRTKITNSSGTFTMKTTMSVSDTIGLECGEKYVSKFKYDDIYKKQGISPSLINNTLAYQIGYRLTEYSGQTSYLSESCYNDKSYEYIYFSMNEFNNARYVNNTVGVLPNSILSNNILAIIPVTSPNFTFTFDNTSDNIFRTRNYMAPIDIARINIKLLDSIGNVLDIQYSDFSFVLQMTTIFDTTIPYTSNNVSIV